MNSRITVLSTVGKFLAIPALLAPAFSTCARADERPNILWLTSEDHGPHMGCYGDSAASTPHVDRLAEKGMRYTHAWSNAPVCAPARTTLISGMYATSLGGQHMRSMAPMPKGTAMYPQLLRQAGYYCTNHVKTDYNLAEPAKVWDASSNRAHWKNRPPSRPFFAVFNSTKSHESKIRSRPHAQVHDPARVRVPAYHPDTPVTRRDWAQYYDSVSEADADAGERLAELADAGLEDDTIIFYFADHGSGMPRNKRWPYNSGLQVPLVVFIPEKFKHLRPPDYQVGGTSDRLVSFVDFAPTVLSLAGVEPPPWMQGRAFLGRFRKEPQPYLFGFRDRMDECIDLVRSATDGRFVYVRNFMPHKIYGQHLTYMFETPTTREWKALHDAGKLTPAQDAFWNSKPPEELYDLNNDRDEVHNLAASPEHQATLARFRQALREHLAEVRDLGFLPEGEIHGRSSGSTPYDMVHEDGKYPFDRVFQAAELASGLRPDAVPALRAALRDQDSAVRYWAALGLLMRGRDVVRGSREVLAAALDDPSPHVRTAAAEALGLHGDGDDVAKSLRVLTECADWSKNNLFVVIEALNAIGLLGDRAASLRSILRSLPTKGPSPSPRYASYVPRLMASLLETPGVAAARPNRPTLSKARLNVVFAIADDWSWPFAGAYGSKFVQTPAFDRVAREGVLFNRAFCASPGCSPSRAAILTGRPIWQLEQAGTHQSGFPKKFAVYPDLLEAAGYHVGYTGKGWGPGNFKAGGRDRNPAGPVYDKKTVAAKPTRGVSINDYAGNFALFLNERPKGRPFCFWYGAHEPHRVYEKGTGLKAGKKLADVAVPPFLPDTPEIRSDLLDYAVEIEWFDRHLGKILTLLNESHELENTVVIVASDNGMPFPRAKANLYEYGTHMPLAIRWPGDVPRGRVVDDFVSQIDLAPTILEAAQVAAPPTIVGRSLVPLIFSNGPGRVDPSRNRVFTARERHSSARVDNLGYPSRALRNADFLYIRNLAPDRWPAGDPRGVGGDSFGFYDIDASPSKTLLIEHRDALDFARFVRLAVDKRPAEELFDLKSDPGAIENLADRPRYTAVLQRLRDELTQWLTATGDPRVLGGGEVFESYPRYAHIRTFEGKPSGSVPNR